MKAGKGTSLAALLLFVGAAALMSGMLRSIVHGFRVPPLPPPTFWGRPQFPEDRVFFAFTLGSSLLIGLGCGIVLAIRREPRIRRFIVGLLGGSALGALAGAQLVTKPNLGMMSIGSLVLIAFGFVIRGATAPGIRAESETEWFRHDDDLDRKAGGPGEPLNGA